MGNQEVDLTAIDFRAFAIKRGADAGFASILLMNGKRLGAKELTRKFLNDMEMTMRNYKFFFWLTISVVAVICLVISSRGHAQNVAAAPAPVVNPVPVRFVLPNPGPVAMQDQDKQAEEGHGAGAGMQHHYAGAQAEDHDRYHHHDHEMTSRNEMPVKEEENIQKSFPLTVSAGKRLLDLDNVFGSIDVVGTQSDQVQLVAHKTIRAETQQDLERAKKEVTLDITQEAGVLKLFVNGPFRCNSKEDCDRQGDDGYYVKFDFKLQVPRELELKLKTVNNGHITVKDVSGHYSVQNVNGSIEMQDVAGSGQAKTVNGGVKISFRENPRENSDFSTINGNVDLAFVSNLSADFRFKTMNGDIYTDFPMTSLPQEAGVSERRDGKFVFHADRSTGGRVGSGGPEIKAENLNGSIRITERQ